MLNNSSLIGRLTNQPTLNITNSNRVYTEATLAVQRNYTTNDGEPITDFIPIQIWGKSAESFVETAMIGDLLSVTGDIRSSSWIDATTGLSRSTLRVNVSGYNLLESQKTREIRQFMKSQNASSGDGGLGVTATEDAASNTTFDRPNFQQTTAVSTTPVTETIFTDEPKNVETQQSEVIPDTEQDSLLDSDATIESSELKLENINTDNEEFVRPIPSFDLSGIKIDTDLSDESTNINELSSDNISTVDTSSNLLDFPDLSTSESTHETGFIEPTNTSESLPIDLLSENTDFDDILKAAFSDPQPASPVYTPQLDDF